MVQKIRPLQTTLQVKLSEKVIEKENVFRIPPARLQRIAVKTTDATHFIKVDEIIHCMADNNYCTIHYGLGLKVMVAKTLKSVGDVLPASSFLRVHNSHIVRMDTIHLVYPDHIVLDNGTSIPVSRTCKKELITRLAVTATAL